MVALMLFATKKIAGKSGKFFVRQQQDLGKVNGYIEEMMHGPEGREGLQPRSRPPSSASTSSTSKLLRQLLPCQQLCKRPHAGQRPASATSATCCAVVAGRGAGAAIGGIVGLTLGTLGGVHDSSTAASTSPSRRSAQQLNSVVMAHGRCRARVPICSMRSPKTDEGYVTLVNAVEHPDGTLNR